MTKKTARQRINNQVKKRIKKYGGGNGIKDIIGLLADKLGNKKCK